MSEERKLQFRGGIGMSLIPVAIYVFFCMVLFIGFKAFNMEALAVGGFLALLIGGVFCTSYSEFWESAIRGISSITSVSVVVILLLVGMFSALIKLCGLSGGFVWIANAVGMKGGIFVAFTFLATCIVSTATGFLDRNHVYRVPDLLPGGDHAGCQRDDDGRAASYPARSLEITWRRSPTRRSLRLPRSSLRTENRPISVVSCQAVSSIRWWQD